MKRIFAPNMWNKNKKDKKLTLREFLLLPERRRWILVAKKLKIIKE